jgi:hypothetical protein
MKLSLLIAVITSIMLCGKEQVYSLSINGPVDMQSGCALINSKFPPQHITFDRLEEAHVDEGRIRDSLWLRLHNNSGCRMVVKALSEPIMSKWEKRPEGGLVRVPLENIRNGAPIELVYDIQEKQRKKEPVHATYNHLVFGVVLPPGQSLSFAVPLKHLKAGYHIVVPFEYEWEENKSGRITVEHRVYFFNGDLPAAILRRR